MFKRVEQSHVIKFVTVIRAVRLFAVFMDGGSTTARREKSGEASGAAKTGRRTRHSSSDH